MPPPEPAPMFGDALHEAIVRRGLPLARVSARLAAAGLPVAQSTISQWQRGHRLPRSPRSLAVVDELETILRTAPGTLRTLAEAEISGIRIPTAPTPVAAQADALDRIVAHMGAPPREMLTTMGCHDLVDIGPTGALQRRRVILSMRAEGHTDRHVVAHTVDPGSDVDRLSFTAVRGCRIGRTVTVPEMDLAATELHFDRRLSPGDTAVVEFVVEDPSPVLAYDYFRWATHPIAHLVIEVMFHRDMRPSTVVAFERSHTEAPDRSCTELPLEHGERAHVVAAPAEAGIHGIRWTWPSSASS